MNRAKKMLPLSVSMARRLAIVAQRLAGPRPRPNREGVLDTVRALRRLQLDPTNTVARSHLLVLWSRLGTYDPTDLDALLWSEKRLFEYVAYIVPIEDYPVYQYSMRRFGVGQSPWRQRVRTFMRTNHILMRHILASLRRNGPLSSRQFEDRSVTSWHSTGWTGGRNVNRMLEFLAAKGIIMVAGRRGGERLWDLAERCLPDWTPRERLSEREALRRIAERQLAALGLARLSHLRSGLSRTLADLESEGRIERIQIQASGPASLRPWYISVDLLPRLERLLAGEWEPRTALLSPFDTLIHDRRRTEELFGFRFRIEIYVPQEKRQYGYFVMPILDGDRVIGRLDPSMDRASGRLLISAVYAEPDAPMSHAAGLRIARAVESLASFLGARDILYGKKIPSAWREALS